MKAKHLSEEDAIAVASAPYLYKKKDCVRAARTLRSIELSALQEANDRGGNRPIWDKSCVEMRVIDDIRRDANYYGDLAVKIEDHIKPARRRE